MGIDPIQFKKMFQMQGAQGAQKTQKTQGVENTQAGQASHKTQGAQQGGSLMDRLNGLDNQLNKGGGVSFNDSKAGQAGGIEEMLKKFKHS